ncbi:MAG: D-alanine--D-alanine ligase [Bdellovibrionales bacterium]|nr:D-alanine--D-alanine ligase [Bdellovibrionales bacterium]
MKKIRVAVLYGGRSGEHEVALRSAASVINNLDRAKFEIVPIGIDKNGKWHLADPALLQQQTVSLPIYRNLPEVVLPSNPGGTETGVVALKPTDLASGGAGKASTAFDVVFPVMHGTNGEDGTVQGLLELAEVAYVGCGVLASAVGMDKDVAKRLIAAEGLPVVPSFCIRGSEWGAKKSTFAARAEKEFGYPCFVKPANSGSSVGVHKVKSAADFAPAVADALRYDTKVLVEKAISAREIELSVLENAKYGEAPLVSVAGEINPTHEFYSYEAKYLDENGMTMKIPADITKEQLTFAQDVARRAFTALECEGLARVDLFLDKNDGKIYFNEVNTMPGFTSISMYPKMWEASGVPYGELLTKLIELAIARKERRAALVRDFTQK